MRTDQVRPSGTQSRGTAPAPAPSPGPPTPAASAAPSTGDDQWGQQIAAAIAAAGAGQQQDDSKDPPVWVGDHQAKTSVMNQKFYGLSQAQLVEFQQRMFAAGLLKNPRYGDYDDDTYALWQGINERASRFYASGKRYTPSDVMDMIGATSSSDSSGRAKAGVDGEPGNVTVKANPLDLEAQVQQAAKSRLGRKLSAKDAARFVSIYQHMQVTSDAQTFAAQQAAQATPGSVDDAGNSVNGTNGASSVLPGLAGPDAAADQFIDHGFAQEAAGQSASSYFQALEQMIGGR